MIPTKAHRAPRAFFSAFALLAAVVLPVAALQMGCIGGGCGIGAVSDSGDGGATTATVSAGELTFEATPVGSAATFVLPVKDSAYTHETILGAKFAGADAADFFVVGGFPIDVPAGASVTLQVTFSPTHTGPASATLMVQTEDMGVSPIQVTGTGE